MSEPSSFNESDSEDDGSPEATGAFASWLPPLLGNSEPAEVSPRQRAISPPTLTGLGPVSAGPEVAALEEPEVAAMEEAEDDEPTRVFSKLFPELLPKVRSRPPAALEHTSQRPLPPRPRPSAPPASAPPELPEDFTPPAPPTLLPPDYFAEFSEAQEQHSPAAPEHGASHQTWGGPGSPLLPARASATMTPTQVTRQRRPVSEAPWSATVRPPKRSRAALLGVFLAFIATAFVTVLVLRSLIPGKGTLLVSARDSSGAAIQGAEVHIDGALACAPAPCHVPGLRAGQHAVSVKTNGYHGVTEKRVEVERGQETQVDFTLDPSTNAGLHVTTDVHGLRIFINGEDRGEAPLTLGGLTPGEHSVRLTGNPGYAPYEQKVTLRADNVLVLEPKLVAQSAILVLRPGSGASGASIEVVGENQRMAVVELPARIEVVPAQSYRVLATRAGYRTYETEIQFAEGGSEREVQIELVALSQGAAGAVPFRAALRNAENVRLEESPPTEAIGGSGTLNLNSIPISNVLVNGRPVGSTPRQIRLSAGQHSVVFVHPELGRKTVTVQVQAGKTALAATKF